MSTNLKTAVDVINAAAKSLGLVTATISDPYASTDANILQLCSLLDEAGQELAAEHNWQLLKHDHSFTTSDSTAEYALPTSPIFDRLVEGTVWDQTLDVPGSPISEQQYQALVARGASITSTLLYFLKQNKFVIYPTPAVGHTQRTIAFAYQSAYWAAGTTEPTADTATAAADKIWFDPRLITLLLKLKFLEAKGFSSVAANKDYQRALDNAKSGDGSAPQLSMAGPRRGASYDPLPVDTLDAS